jgi:adenylate cyclase
MVIVSASLIALLFVGLGLFRGIEATLSDRLFSTRTVTESIVIIAIDDATLSELGQWPLPRATIATGLQKIIDAEPKTVGIDIIFAEPSRLGTADDAVLAAVLRESTVPVTLPVEALALSIPRNDLPYTNELLRTLPLFDGPLVRLGHINLIKDRDGLVRRFPTKIVHDGAAIPSFVSQITGVSSTAHTERVVWSGPPGTIESIPFRDVLDPAFDDSRLRDAYVFIGATAANLHDTQTTPVSEGTPMAGVEIQAQIAHMSLSGASLTALPATHLALWLFGLIVLVASSFFLIRNVALATLTTLGVGVANLILISICFERGISVDIVWTTLTLCVAAIASFLVRYFFLERERREIRGVFSKYVSGAVLDELLKDPASVKLGGSEAEVTVFFSDIRGFTSFSEQLTPSELTSLLNRYLTRMTDIILADKGVVDKYIGDAIMAFWGAPLRDAAHPYQAIRSALTMLDALDVFNTELNDPKLPKVNIGIGLNTGTVVVGNMGSEQRFDYTIMGDTVNLGSRIEGQTKTYGIRLLASEMTIRAYEHTGIADPDIVYREIDKVTVKGKKEPVALFEVIEHSRRTFVASIHDDFEMLRAQYYAGTWNDVIMTGKRILERGEDGPTRVLYERAVKFAEHPPTLWRGVYELTSK